MWLRRDGCGVRTRMCAWEAGAGLRVGKDVGMSEALHGRQEGARTARTEAMGRDRRRLRRGGVGFEDADAWCVAAGDDDVG